jgi:hypothetical protein
MEHITGNGMAVCFVVFLFLMILAYLVVLAIAAPQVTVTEKYRSRPTATGKNRLLPAMLAERGYDGEFSGTAETSFALKAVGAALAGAYIAVCKPLPQPLRPLGKLTGFIQGKIVWLIRAHSLALKS